MILTRSIAGISLFLKACFKGTPNSSLKQIKSIYSSANFDICYNEYIYSFK